MRPALADLRYALLVLRRRPAGIVVPLITMAIGIGASTAIFSALYAALFRPLPYPEPERLVMGRATFGGQVNPWVAAPDFFDYRERNSVFQSLSAYLPRAARVTIRQGDGAESVPLTRVSWDLFRTLGVNPVMGRHFTPAEGERGAPSVAIVSHGYWQRALGGSRDVIGRTLPLSVGGQAQTVTIVGVMPEGFRFAYAADVWVAMQRNGPGADVRRFHNWMLLGRLKPGVSLIQAQKDVDRISVQLQREYPDSNRNKALLVTRLQDALAENDRPSLLILMAAVGVLLLVACADVAGLLLSRGSMRQAEMAIRSALGATRAQLVRQLLAESLLVAAAAGASGLVLATWLRHLVLRLVPLDPLGLSELPFEAPVLLFAVGATFITSAIVGIVPAVLGTRVRAVDELKSGSHTTDTRSRSLALQGLVALQVAMSIVLLVAAALLGRSLMQLRAVDPGFRSDHLITAQVWLAGQVYEDPAARARFFKGLLDDFRALPGVTAATIVNNLPVVDPAGNIPAWDAEHPPAQTSEAPLACVRIVLPGYFQAMGIPLIAGRDLSENDAGEPPSEARSSATGGPSGHRPPVMVISQSLGRRLFRDRNPLGRRIGIFTGDAQPVVAEVVGVVGDVRMNSLGNDYSLAMYVHYRIATEPVMRVAVRTAGDPAAVAPALRAALARRDRGLVLDEVMTMDARVASSVQGFSLRAGAVALFGAAGLLLAMLGVYGVLAFMVNRRRPDIGLRIVMGATRRDILRWVLARGMGAVLVGMVIGLLAAVGVGRLLRGQLFNVPPTDAATFAGVSVCLVGAALAACLLPAWRAIHVDPIVALRAE
jgi:putative ABC transport system permease protein